MLTDQRGTRFPTVPNSVVRLRKVNLNQLCSGFQLLCGVGAGQVRNLFSALIRTTRKILIRSFPVAWMALNC